MLVLCESWCYGVVVLQVIGVRSVEYNVGGQGCRVSEAENVNIERAGKALEFERKPRVRVV